MKLIESRSLLCWAILTLASASASEAQTLIVALTLEEGSVSLVRRGTVEEAVPQVADPLASGDELRGHLSESQVQVACSPETTLTFTGLFRVLVMPPVEDLACAINLMAGSVDGTGSDPVDIITGERTLGIRGTQFHLSTYREDQRLIHDIVVFEGVVVVRTGVIEGDQNLRRAVEVSGGGRVRLDGLEVASGSLTLADVNRSANVYAGIDLARNPALGRESRDDLFASYAQVLTEPANTEHRLALAVTQVNLGVTSSATIYHLNLAESALVESPQEVAAIALTRAITFDRMGRTEDATFELSRAYEISPDVANPENLERLKFDVAVMEQINAFRHRLGGVGVAVLPSPTDVPDDRFRAMTVALERGRIDEAERLAEVLRQVYPTRGEPWEVLGNLRRRRGDMEAALNAFRTAAEAYPPAVMIASG